MRQVPDLDEETITQIELHAALEECAKDGVLTPDEQQIILAIIPVWGKSIGRLDRIARNQREAVKHMLYGLRVNKRIDALSRGTDPIDSNLAA